MEVRLTIADRFGIMHVLATLEGVNLEMALQMRSIRKDLDITDLLDGATVKDLAEKAKTAPAPYTLELGRIEWLVVKIKEQFDARKVSPLFSDYVLSAYEVLTAAKDNSPAPQKE